MFMTIFKLVAVERYLEDHLSEKKLKLEALNLELRKPGSVFSGSIVYSVNY